MKGFRVRIIASLAGIALCALLAGCGGNDSGALVDADDECTGNPLAPALPDESNIASKSFAWRQCLGAQVSACYSNEDSCSGAADRCLITLHDALHGMRADVGSGTEVSPHEHSQGLILGFSKMNVEMLVGTHDSLLTMPVFVEQMGGPDHLPVVGTTASGDTFAIPVPSAHQGPRQGDLMSVIADRYALTIECSEPIRNNPHARRIYEPFLGALRLAELP